MVVVYQYHKDIKTLRKDFDKAMKSFCNGKGITSGVYDDMSAVIASLKDTETHKPTAQFLKAAVNLIDQEFTAFSGVLSEEARKLKEEELIRAFDGLVLIGLATCYGNSSFSKSLITFLNKGAPGTELVMDARSKEDSISDALKYLQARVFDNNNFSLLTDHPFKRIKRLDCTEIWKIGTRLSCEAKNDIFKQGLAAALEKKKELPTKETTEETSTKDAIKEASAEIAKPPVIEKSVIILKSAEQEAAEKEEGLRKENFTKIKEQFLNDLQLYLTPQRGSTIDALPEGDRKSQWYFMDTILPLIEESEHTWANKIKIFKGFAVGIEKQIENTYLVTKPELGADSLDYFRHIINGPVVAVKVGKETKFVGEELKPAERAECLSRSMKFLFEIIMEKDNKRILIADHPLAKPDTYKKYFVASLITASADLWKKLIDNIFAPKVASKGYGVVNLVSAMMWGAKEEQEISEDEHTLSEEEASSATI